MKRTERDRRIDYIEFPAVDIADTKKFFATVFGWTFTDHSPGYTSFKDGRLRGGFDKARRVANGGPLVVLYAKDLEGAKADVIKHGGHITKETITFPGGRRFHFKDPSGNELGVWSE